MSQLKTGAVFVIILLLTLRFELRLDTSDLFFDLLTMELFASMRISISIYMVMSIILTTVS